MSRILALDYGTKRTGVAVTDELRIIASGLTTVATADLIPFLKAYVSKEKVSLIVIGQPKRLHNEMSDVESDIVKFIALLKKTISSIDIDRIDERFTSKMAFQSLLQTGQKKKVRQDKALIDEISATIILQDYLAGMQ